MRKVVVALAALTLALPAFAQAPVPAHDGFRQAATACRLVVEANGKGAAEIMGKAGLISGPMTPQTLRTSFFKDVARVDAWSRPVAQGSVQVGYDPTGNQCRVFLLGTARGDLVRQTLQDLPAGWFVHEADKTSVRRREDGTLTVATVLGGNESKGVEPGTLTAVAIIWHNTAK